jgi:hypothetical protein
MSLQFGGKTEVVREVVPKPDGVYEQSGAVKLPPHQDVTVYYPVPYLSPPNLTVLDTPRYERPFRVTEQRADRFRAENNSSEPIMVEWWSKGLRVVPVPFAPVVVPAGAAESLPAAAPLEAPAELPKKD